MHDRAFRYTRPYIKRYRAFAVWEADLGDIEEAESFPLRECVSERLRTKVSMRVAYRRQCHVTIEPLLVCGWLIA